MKIQLNAVKMNKTKKYLLPCLKEHGDELILRLNTVRKLAYGLGDMSINKKYEKHIFILIDTSKSKTNFISFIDWLHDQEYYEDDYAFDDIHTGRLHMVIIKLPESCYGKHDFFTKGEYSKMYSLEEINQFKNEEIKRVLIKDKNYIVEFTKKINEIFNSDLKPVEVGDRELDLPPYIQSEEEIF